MANSPSRPFGHLGDAYAPSEMARRVVEVGGAKAKLSTPDSLILGVLAGAFIGLGAAFATLAMTGSGLGFGPTRVLGGVAFSLGLILVIVAGAELFTGNNLVAMAWASRIVTTTQLVRNWILVYVGNFVGGVATALLVFWTGTAGGGNAIGMNAVRIAAAKCELGFGEAFFRGVLCNSLVCLAVWLCQSARTTTDKVLAIVWPITAFVALGFEHSVANMYFIPLGILLKRDASVVSSLAAEGTAVPEVLSVSGLVSNLVPVTLGNIVGGTLMVAGVYWFVYLRTQTDRVASE